MPPRDLQHETLRIYKTLVDEPEDRGGKLILVCGTGCAHSGAPAAVSIAGGATLAIDSDAAAMKSAMRAGYLDFVVNSLDEAQRTLKNEIRLRRPLSVGLISDVDAALTEIIERGIQPDLYLVPANCSPVPGSQIRILKQRGTVQLHGRGLHDEGDGFHPIIRPLLILNRQRRYEHFFAAADASALRSIDAALLAALPPADTLRRRWIDRVPRYLREARSGGRWIWLSEDELASLAATGITPQPSS